MGNYHIAASMLWAHTLADLVATCSFPMLCFPDMKWRVKASAYILSSQVQEGKSCSILILAKQILVQKTQTLAKQNEPWKH